MSYDLRSCFSPWAVRSLHLSADRSITRTDSLLSDKFQNQNMIPATDVSDGGRAVFVWGHELLPVPGVDEIKSSANTRVCSIAGAEPVSNLSGAYQTLVDITTPESVILFLPVISQARRVT